MFEEDDFLQLGDGLSLKDVVQTSRKREHPSSNRENVTVDELDISEASAEENEESVTHSDFEDYLYRLAESESNFTGLACINGADLDFYVAQTQQHPSDIVCTEKSSEFLSKAQVTTVRKMHLLENSSSFGGTLIEPNPYDKTFMMLEMAQMQSHGTHSDHLTEGIVDSRATLVLTANALTGQWVSLIRSFLPKNKKVLSGNVFHRNVFDLARADFVVANYAYTMRCMSLHPQYQHLIAKALSIRWDRIIFDEPSLIEYYEASAFPCQINALGLLRSKYRWLSSIKALPQTGSFEEILKYIFILNLPVLERLPRNCAYSINQIKNFQNDPMLFFGQSAPRIDQKKFGPRFAEALQQIEVRDGVQDTQVQPTYLQRVSVRLSPNEQQLQRAFLKFISSKIKRAYKHVTDPKFIADTSIGTYFQRILRVETYNFCLKLRELALSPRLFLRYIEQIRKLPKFELFDEENNPKEEAKVHILRKRLGVLSNKQGTKPLSKHSHDSQHEYARQILRSIEASEEIDSPEIETKLCEICYETSIDDDGAFLPCGHQMCHDCAKRCFSTKHHCPFCKQRASLKDVVSIKAIRSTASAQNRTTNENGEISLLELSYEKYFFDESSKTQQVATDIESVMKSHSPTRPNCLILTDYHEHNLAIANELQSRNIATMRLGPNFKRSFAYSKLMKGSRSICQNNLRIGPKFYHVNAKHQYEKDLLEAARTKEIEGKIYQSHRLAETMSIDHSSELISGSAVIANFSLLHTSIDLSWVDFVFVMEPFVFGSQLIYSVISKCMNARRSTPVRVTLYESLDSLDERINRLLLSNELNIDPVDADSDERQTFLAGDPAHCLDVSSDVRQWQGKQIRKVNTDHAANKEDSDGLPHLDAFLLRASVDEIMAMVGLQ